MLELIVEATRRLQTIHLCKSKIYCETHMVADVCYACDKNMI